MTEYLDRYPTMHEYAEGKRINPKLTDLISRADAIDAVMAEGRKVYTSEYANAERIIHEADAVETLSMLPSANAVDGKWLKVEPFEYVYKCSECGHEPVYEGDILKMHFCPNCGARMDAERREP